MNTAPAPNPIDPTPGPGVIASNYCEFDGPASTPILQDAPAKVNREEIQRACRLLFADGQVVELRTMTGGKFGTTSGYYNNFSLLATDAAKLSQDEKNEAVYVTLQELNPVLLARRSNKLKFGVKDTTSDPHVLKYRWLPIDVDTKRPGDISGISSSREERTETFAVALQLREYLASLGIQSVLADSGNGFHILPKINLPSSDEPLVRKCLESLAAKFDTDYAKVDQKVFNPGRIWKLYGTVVRKGDHTQERPHRGAQILEVPDSLPVVPRALLETIAAGAPSADTRTDVNPSGESKISEQQIQKLEDFLAWGNIAHGERMEYKAGYKYQLENCPFNPDHAAPDSAVYLLATGAMAFKCSHNSCSGKDWKQFRAVVEKTRGSKFQFVEPKVSQVSQTAQPATNEVRETPELEATPMSDPGVYKYPKECLEGDLLADLTHEITDGTFLPPQFAYGDLQVYTGHLLDGFIEPPSSSYLEFSTRFYHNKVSLSPEVGKYEVWLRILATCSDQFKDTDIIVPTIVDGQKWGSGHYMVRCLEETPNCIAVLDEGKSMWLKAPSEVASLEDKWLQCFSKNECSDGSIKNGGHHAKDVHLSQTAGFTLQGFNDSFQGQGRGGSGYLSRVALSLGERMPTNGEEWPILKQTKAFVIGRQIMETAQARTQQRTELSIDPDAKTLKKEFKSWLETQDGHFASRLNYYFEKDCALRTVFSGGNQTKDGVQRSIRWVEEQLKLRKRLWPIDSINIQGVVEYKILQLFETPETIRSDRQLKQALHIGKRDGKYSAQQYGWAIKALRDCGSIEIAGRNRTGKMLYRKPPEESETN